MGFMLFRERRAGKRTGSMAAPRALHRIEDAITAGAPLAAARAAVILVHGRGGTPEDMLPLAEASGRRDIAYIAPRASGNTWYPLGFLAPIEQNEPFLSSALELLAALIADLETKGMPAEKIGLVGFSQGACLSSEFAARNAKRYGFVAALTGGLIGPPGTPRNYSGSLDGTPVFIGSSDVDPHIPLERIRETTAVLGALGATVDERIYGGMGHIVNDDEVEAVRALLARIAGPAA
jgi:predicted esterase